MEQSGRNNSSAANSTLRATSKGDRDFVKGRPLSLLLLSTSDLCGLIHRVFTSFIHAFPSLHHTQTIAHLLASPGEHFAPQFATSCIRRRGTLDRVVHNHCGGNSTSTTFTNHYLRLNGLIACSINHDSLPTRRFRSSISPFVTEDLRPSRRQLQALAAATTTPI